MIKRNKSTIIFLALLLTGVFLRCFLLGTIPPGLNQDEASIGYEAFAISNYGIDRNGFHNPVHLVSWGSGQNALYAYFSMPFISLLGLSPLSTRLVNAIFGSISLIIFYLLIKNIFNKEVALVSLFLLVISPWHIMMSRWGLESNLFPSVFLLGFYLLVLSFDRQYLFPVSFFVFAIALYSYGTSYFFIPILILTLSVYLIINKKIKLKYFICGLAVLALTALPILLFFIINTFKLDSIHTPWFTIPRLTIDPLYVSDSTFFHSDFLANSLHNFIDFLKFFLVTQNDKSPFNSVPRYGYMYLFSVPFMIFGIIQIIIANKKVNIFNKSFLLLLWFFVSLSLAFFLEANINRLNIIFLPTIFFTSYGVISLKNRVPRSFGISIALYFLAFLFFLHTYFFVYSKAVGPYFYESFGEAINFAVAKSDASSRIYITNRVRMPYIFVLFYQKIDPHKFIDTVNYYNPGDKSQWVDSFGRFKFGFDGINHKENACYIIHKSDRLSFPKAGFSIKQFKEYYVVFRK